MTNIPPVYKELRCATKADVDIKINLDKNAQLTDLINTSPLYIILSALPLYEIEILPTENPDVQIFHIKGNIK
jgi:hypothetical protein